MLTQQTSTRQQPTLSESENTTSFFVNHGPIPWATVTWVFIALGVFLRVFHFLDNRSLWIDEVYLASSLIKMDFVQLASPPLDYEQKAPIGFLWMVRIAVMVFGEGEMALRLFPLVCGIASLFAFRSVARFFLKPLGVAVALGMLALAPPLVYHAVEVKQYGTALLATTLALLLYIRYHGKFTVPHLVSWGFWGALLIWFSYAVIFILAGIAFGVCLTYLLKKKWKALFYSVIPFSMWLVSFAINFFMFTYKHADSEWLVHWFRIRESFMPFPPSSPEDFKWFFARVFLMLDYPLGLLWNFSTLHTDSKLLQTLLRMPVIPVVFLATGLIELFRNNKTTLMVLLFPFCLTLLASGLELYPFYERLVVFLAPALMLFIAFGTQKIAAVFPARAGWQYIIPFLILLAPLHASARQVHNTELFGGRKHWHLRDALLYVHERAQEQDVVYISWNALPEYRFYKQVYGFKFKVIEGKDVRLTSKNASEYLRNLEPDFKAMASYNRAWLVLNKIMGANIGEIEAPNDVFGQEIKDGKRIVSKLSTMGKQVDAYKSTDMDVFLFDFPNN